MAEPEDVEAVWADIEAEFKVVLEENVLQHVSSRKAAARLMFWTAVLNGLGLSHTIPALMEVGLRSKMKFGEELSLDPRKVN